MQTSTGAKNAWAVSVVGMDARQLSEIALGLAGDGFDERVAELVQASGGDTQALLDAADDVRQSATTAGTREHIAFTYLSAAFDRLAGSRQRR